MPLRSRRAASTPPSSSRRATIRRPREPHSPSERERRSPKPAAERSCRKKSCEPRPKIASAPSEPTTSEGNSKDCSTPARSRSRPVIGALGSWTTPSSSTKRTAIHFATSAIRVSSRTSWWNATHVPRGARARAGAVAIPTASKTGMELEARSRTMRERPSSCTASTRSPASRASSSTAEDAATPGGRAWSSAGIAGTSGPSSIAPETSPARSSGTRRMRSPPSSQATRWSVTPSGRSVSRGERR